MNKRKAVVIFSGGQDSTTCLFWAIKHYDKVYPITFKYGQKHIAEVDSAWKIAYDEIMQAGSKIPVGAHKFVDISFLKDLSGSALLDPSVDLNQLNDKGLPNSFVPNRNQLFITIAHAYAQLIGAQTIVTGVCETDYSGYPDCRADFIALIETTTNRGSQSNISIQTPLMKLDKAATFKMAEELGCLDIILEKTITCYNGIAGTGCGTCPACELRKKGYEKYLEMK